MFASLFLLLYVAHHLADYPGQTDHQAAHKADPGWAGWRVNLVHAGTHAALALALLLGGGAVLGLHLSALGVVVGVAWMAGTHAFIDRRWPVRWWMETTGQGGYIAHGGMLTVDQAAHIGLGLLPAALILATLH